MDEYLCVVHAVITVLSLENKLPAREIHAPRLLAFFRGDDAEGITAAKEPWKKLIASRKRKGSLKGCHIGLDQKFTNSFVIKLPKSESHFGYSLIRVY